MKLTNAHRQGVVQHGRTLLTEYAETNVAICHYDNFECQALANEIAGLLVAAGWSRHTCPLVKLQPVTGLPEGSGVVVADQPADEASALIRMLKSADIEASTRHVERGGQRLVGTAELLLEIWPD